MPRRIVIVEGYPDADDARLGHALAEAYAEAALAAGHEVRRIRIGALEVPVIRTRADWDSPTAARAGAEARPPPPWERWPRGLPAAPVQFAYRIGCGGP